LEAIEDAATSIEIGWPRKLATGDDATAGLIEVATRSIAATIRSLKEPIILAAPGPQDQLLAKITSIFTALASGHWDSIPRQDPIPHPSMRYRVLESLKALLLGTAPLLLVLAAKRFGLLQDPKMLDWAAFSGFIWFMVTLLLMLDPLLLKKAEAIKTATQVLTFWRSDKE